MDADDGLLIEIAHRSPSSAGSGGSAFTPARLRVLPKTREQPIVY